jgi:Xaa-Pro aminopeptidase
MLAHLDPSSRRRPHCSTAVPAAVAGILLAASALPLSAQKDVAFPPEVYAGRRARVLDAVGGEPVVLAGRYLIRADEGARQDPDFWYLTGVESPYAILVMSRGADGRPVETLFVPAQYQFTGAQYPIDDARFRRSAWNVADSRLYPGPEAVRRTGIRNVKHLDEFSDRLPALLGNARTIHVLHDGSGLYGPPGMSRPLTIGQQFESDLSTRLPGVTLADVRPVVRRMRLVKDRWEIEALRKAATISADGLIEAMRSARPGMNDLEMAGLMEYVWKKEGSPHASFGPIVMSGDAGVSLYTIRAERYHSTDRVMRAGELVFVDYGAAEFDTYASDVCRTFPVTGRFTDEQRKWYEIVLEAQEAGIRAVRPGVMMIDVIRAAAGVFRDHGLEANEDIAKLGEAHVWGVMPSPTYWLARQGGLTDYSGARGTGVRDLGHHIGLEALDSRDYTVPLQSGMVFTIEPKLYIPDLGIAIMVEDMILVTDSGHENLSVHAPRTVADIEALMAQRRGTGASGSDGTGSNGEIRQ